ncbi:hypothetical protein M2266_002585 [Streptomyces sp. SPB162]|nr:hypothetical protein [Streptomyces sp. SPB162]
MDSTASLMLNGLAAMSPASATWASANGEASCAGLYGRSSREASRMALPPNRAPGRYETPLSNGTPTTATSAVPTSSSRGSRANVAGPAYRGMRDESMGPRGSLLLIGVPSFL